MSSNFSYQTQLALQDFRATIARPSTWVTLGWLDLKRQYRRTFLGPVWLTLSTAILITSFSLIWSQIFGNPIEEYLPNVAIGFVMFNLMSQFVVDGSKSLVASSAVISQTQLPILSAILRQSWFFIFMFLHHLVVTVTVIGITIPSEVIRPIEASIGIIGVLLNCVLCQIWLSILCLRFRDLSLVFANIMQVLFFISPVMWLSSALSGKTAEILSFNPVAIGIEIVRNPLTGVIIDFGQWGLLGVYTAINTMIGTLVFITMRRHIAFWV